MSSKWPELPLNHAGHQPLPIHPLPGCAQMVVGAQILGSWASSPSGKKTEGTLWETGLKGIRVQNRAGAVTPTRLQTGQARAIHRAKSRDVMHVCACDPVTGTDMEAALCLH